MSLRTLLKVQTLQAALHAKAKGSPSFSDEANWRKSKRLSSRGLTHGAQAATVVAYEAQGAGTGNDTLPGRIPVPEAESDSARSATAQLHVGDSVSSCPKAGCGKTARPV